MKVNYSKKREFLMLAETYNSAKDRINGWFISTKLDGMRAFWDGNITRGMKVKDVPWANTEKDYRLINEPISTGLWSRLGKCIYAPDEFLDALPNIPLDGELWIGSNQFQKLQSIVKTHSYSDWTDVKLKVIDSPPLEEIFKDGKLEVRVGNQKYSREFKGILDWIATNKKHKIKVINKGMDFSQVYSWLKKQDIENSTIQLIEQIKLPSNPIEVREVIDKRFDEVLLEGAEGLVIRAPYESWRPMRASYILKYKPFHDSEGIVSGYVSGREGKHEGRMGALIVDWKGKSFKLSGFTDQERIINHINNGQLNFSPEEVLSEEYINPMFPRGTVITFRYRELSDDLAPKEGRYLRKRID